MDGAAADKLVERQRMDNRKELNGHDSYGDHELVLHNRPGPILNARHSIDHASGPSEAADDFAVLLQYGQLLWKSKRLLLAIGLVGALFATAITLQMTPLYKAKTSLEIENVQEPFVAANPMMTADAGLVTHIQLLTSASMRERAVSKLKLRTDIQQAKVSGPLVTLHRLLRMAEPSESIPWNQAISMAAGSVTIKNAKDSHLVEIESESSDPR